jgi:hypothetical protein
MLPFILGFPFLYRPWGLFWLFIWFFTTQQWLLLRVVLLVCL